LGVHGGGIPHEPPWRIDPEEDRPAHALGVLLGVQQGDAGPVALAEQVDLVVAERHTSVVNIGKQLGDRVAVDIDTVASEPGGCLCRGVGDTASRRLAENIALCMAQRPRHLGTVELH
jgi:hypothetical protein